MYYEASFFEAYPEGKVKCRLCPHQCILPPGKTGICRVRENREGKLYTRNYAQVSSYALDPIEKKPLYHFYPGSSVFSLGTVGCNFTCQYCQNWEIAHSEPDTIFINPQRVVDITWEIKKSNNCIGLAYTYSEPVVWYEYVRETAEIAKEAGLKNILVTNGFIQEAPLKELIPFIDAMNIDVKAYTNEFYRRWCKGYLEPVLRTIEYAVNYCHIELTTLIIPGLNDKEEEITALAEWVAKINKAIPLHFSRYFPNYKLTLPPTPVRTMEREYALAREQLDYVYLGNLPGYKNNTYCPGCGKAIIHRETYQTKVTGIKDKKCLECGEPINIVI